MTLPTRHVGRNYTWNKPESEPYTLGKLVKIVTSESGTRILHFADGCQYIDDIRVTEINRNFFGGTK